MKKTAMNPHTADSKGGKRKKILLFITRLNNGGPAKIVVWLSTFLDPAKFEITLVTGKTEENEDDILWFARKYGVEPILFPWLRRSVNPLRDLAAVFRFYAVLVRFRPDILHTHMSKAGFIGRSAAVLYNRLHSKKIKLVHTFHGHVFHSYFSPFKTGIFIRLERWLARRTDALIAISDQMFCEIHGRYGVGRAEQFRVVRLGTDFNAGMPRKTEGRKSGVFRIGMMGRIAPIKNYPLAVDIAAELKKRGLSGRIVVAGGGTAADLDDFQTAISKRKLDEHIRFIGNVVEPERFWKEMDLALVTSRNEGTPLSLIEAMFSGLPFVASRVGGIPDMVVGEPDIRGHLLRYGNAVLVDGFSAKDFTDAIALFHTDEDYRKEAGECGRERALTEYGLEQLRIKSQKVYNGVLD